ncbi:hypothetical protein [Amycolatopsis taiwanensis]|uniref:hypothetical protein n=1 Tax=Amycolatopsis taiwanensis TaxID=342230 RepID=UPI0004840BF2|nr:hypothetical protein [Amycolatopsis taiwanensis]
MRLTDPLNARQLDVLRWIANGCPDGVMSGDAHKLTARALQSRRLITVTKRKGFWSAAVTSTGRYYLEHGRFPAPSEKPLPKAKRETPSQPKVRATEPSASSGDTPREPPRPVKKPSAAEQLVAEVIAAGGVLELPADADHDGYRMAQLARIANRHGKTPPGKRLVHQIVHDGSWLGPRRNLFVLEDGPAGADAPLEPVPVPDEVGRYHPAVSALRKAKRIDVSPAAQGRALRILHAVAVDAERRGFTVSDHRPKPNSQQGTPAQWHLLLSDSQETVPLRISEETDRVEHVPTAKELKEKERRPWISIPSHVHVPSGRLRIDLGGPADTERRSFWADRASWTLEEKLPGLLREVAVRADELRLRREAQKRAETQYRDDVAREQERARARAAEAHRLKILQQQLERWREVRELRTFAATLTERLAKADAGDGTLAEAHRWLEWITEHADRRDPFRTLPGWPEPPQLHTWELDQYMNRVHEPPEMRYRPEKY